MVGNRAGWLRPAVPGIREGASQGLSWLPWHRMREGRVYVNPQGLNELLLLARLSFVCYIAQDCREEQRNI